jgi:hypothetical protein
VERHGHRHAVERAHDPLDQRPVRREDQHLVARLADRPHRGAEPTGRPGGDQHVRSLGGHAGEPALSFDHRVEQQAHAVR